LSLALLKLTYSYIVNEGSGTVELVDNTCQEIRKEGRKEVKEVKEKGFRELKRSGI
jgi:hypothetical protein